MGHSGIARSARGSSIVLSLLALALARGGTAEEPFPCLETVPTDLGSLDLSLKWHVRGIFIVPSDREFRDCLQERLTTWARMAQRFYREEMAFEGYRDASGQGKTFRFETDEEGRWKVVLMRGQHEAAWYQERYTWIGGAVLDEMYLGLPYLFKLDNVVMYMYDTVEVGVRSFQYSGQVGGGFLCCGGYVHQGSHFLGLGFNTLAVRVEDQRAIFEDTTPSGLGDTRAQCASTCVGGAIHELGHAFGLGHFLVDYDGDGIENNIMGNGFRRFAGRYTQLDYVPYTQLGWECAELLDGAVMFNQARALTISEMEPSAAAPGEEVLLRGDGFAEGDTFGTMEPSLVLVDGEPAETRVLRDSLLAFLVPADLPCGPREIRVRNTPLGDPDLVAVESDPVTLSVLDGDPPEILCPGPVTVTVTGSVGSNGAVVAYPEADVFDRCDPSPSCTFDPPPGTFLGPGQTEVTCTATDASGHESTCTFTVKVEINRGTVSLGAKPPAVFLDASRAIAFAGALEAGGFSERLRWSRARFRNIAWGSAAELVEEATFFLDEDGDGILDPADPPAGRPASFGAEDGTLTIEDVGVEVEPGEAVRFLLVLKLAHGRALATAPPPGIPPQGMSSGDRGGRSGGAGARVRLSVCLGCAALLVVLSLRGRRGSLPLLAGIAGALLYVAPVGCGGGGGGDTSPAASGSIQVQLESLECSGCRSDIEFEVQGLPVSGWPLDV